MSWASIITTGRGEHSYRLEIERYAEQWVTHVSMASATRRPTLKIRGTKLKCIANPVTNELDVSGFAAAITDAAGWATASFATFPTSRTWLTANITPSSTTMPVRSTTGWETSGYLWIDSECMTYSGVTSTSFTGLTRGALGTLAQSHYIAAVGATRFPEVTDLPVSMAGARARLYAYGSLDDPQGDGTQIWQGVVPRHPTMVGPEWLISIDPITSVLDRTVSSDLSEPATPRGIYYHFASPFSISFFRPDTLSVIDISFPRTTSDRGFFESNTDFCSYLTDRIASAVDAEWPGHEIQLLAVADGEGSWHMEISSDGTAVEVYNQPGIIDPKFTFAPLNEDGDSVYAPGVGWAADVVYSYLPTSDSAPGAGSVPRGYYGTAIDPLTSGGIVEAFPATRVHLSGVVDISSLVDAVAARFEAFGPVDERTFTTTVTDSNSTSNWVVLAPALGTGVFPIPVESAFTSASLPEFRFGRTFTADGSVWTALSTIIAAAPEGLNAGGTPDLRSTDFDTSSWAELDALEQPRIVRSRVFRSFTDASLMDVVRAELTLAGYFLGVTASGEISISKLRNVVTTTAPDSILSGVTVSHGNPTWESSAYGVVNQIHIRRGYDPIEDEYMLPPVIVRDVAGFGRNPRSRPLSIDLKSVPAGGLAETFAECVETSARLFAVFASPYARIQVNTNMTQFVAARVGGIASITTKTLLPDPYTGTRGLNGLRALITGREVNLDEGVVSLKCLAVLNNATGYAPQSVVTAESNVSGDTWDVTVLATGYLPTGTDASDWFLPGDLVFARGWDTTSGTTISGSVVSTTGNVVRVAFTSSAAGLTTGDWYLSYANSNSSLQAAQFAFCYLADSAGGLDQGGDSVPADSFA
jgi:hypothetical protein